MTRVPGYGIHVDSCGAELEGRARLGVFDTEVELRVYHPSDAPLLRRALEAACERCWHFERILSRTRADSDLSRAHAAAPEAVEVAPETAEIVAEALAYAERTGGLFDVTMGTVSSLWDFKARVVPSRLALARACGHVGAGKVHVAHAADGLPPRLSIDDPACILDLGGIAKGYIADDLAALFSGFGIRRIVLNLGGNVLVRGGRPASDVPAQPGGTPWRIGIADPCDPERHRAAVLLASGSVVTSGSHERRFIQGGRIYHHILSPKDGMPVRTDVASATIVSERSVDGDAFSTTAFMLGSRRALSFVEGEPGVDALIIDEADRVLWTSGLSGRIELAPPRHHRML